jgi:ribosomal protein S14
MLFGTLEIAICLSIVMVLIFSIGVGLAAQNLALDRKKRWLGLMPCPHCGKALNPEAYICRHCLREIATPLIR